MRLSKRFSLIAAVTALLLCVAGCNTSGCIDNQSSLPLAGFYDQQGRAVRLDSLEISGLGAPGDSMLYTVHDHITEAYLPLRAQGDQVVYRFHYASIGVSDTVGFFYRSFPYFASEECGAMYRYQLQEVLYSQHIIDSIAVVDSMITNSPVQQLKIYFRVSEPQ